jgi:hypothetical protein
MATGVQTWSKTAASNATADSNVNWAEGQAPSSVNDSARGEMASVAKWRDDISGTVTTSGFSTAYTMATNQGFATAAAMSGAMLTFIPHTTSGVSPTLAVDGLTARQIRSATGVNIATGALIAGTPYTVTYIHASTEFILMNYTEVMGSPTFTGNLTVNGTSTLTGAVTFSGGGNFGTGTFSGAATFSGALIFSSTLGVTGNFAVNTNKFNVTAASGNTTVAGTLGVTSDVAINTNKATITASSGNIATAGSVLSSSASGGIGYATGAGGTVTQSTSKTTSVTLNAITGQVTMNGATLAAGAVASFFITNSAAATGDVVVINHFNIGSAGSYTVNARTSTNGRIDVDVRNNTGGSLTEAIVLSFALIKAVTS